MKQYLLLLQLVTLFSVCYSYIFYKCTYMSITGETTIKACDACCAYDCCPQKPVDGKSLAIILCCAIGIPLILFIVGVCLAVRIRRRRLAQLRSRNSEIAARDLAAFIFLTSHRQQEARLTASEVSSSLADPPHYDDVVKGQS